MGSSISEFQAGGVVPLRRGVNYPGPSRLEGVGTREP